MALAYDAAALARLDKLYSTPQIADQRRRLRALIGARPGETGLDVGCGAGHLACELAGELGEVGRLVAIDNSADSVEASRVRVLKAGLDRIVDSRICDAAALDFPDQTFDFVVAAQVYCYVPEVARAVCEAARVLRKGGRLVVLESDWDLCTWESADRPLTRRMVAARGASQFAHANLPRDVHRLMRNAGLTLSDARAFSIMETRYEPGSFGAGIIENTAQAALKQGIPASEVAAWKSDLRSRTAEGEWFFCLNRFMFLGTKEPRGHA